MSCVIGVGTCHCAERAITPIEDRSVDDEGGECVLIDSRIIIDKMLFVQLCQRIYHSIV